MPTKKQEAGYAKTFPKRMRAWKHNALMGQATRAEMFFMAVVNSDTTTDKAKEISLKLFREMENLKIELKTRIDP